MRHVAAALFAFSVWGVCGPYTPADEAPAVDRCLKRVCPDYLVKPQQARAWHALKDKFGPALSGNRSWQRYLKFVEQSLKQLNAADVGLNVWTYDRWHTSQWPDASRWSLTVDGQPVRVASYGAYSGSTPPAGITAPLVYFDAADPPADLRGKIVVFQPRLTPAMIDLISSFDYESPPVQDSYPEPGGAVPAEVQPVSGAIWAQLQQVGGFIEKLTSGGAAGGIFVFDSTFDQLAGLYTFPVPKLYQAPSLYLDRTAGAAVVAAAKRGQTATLRLEADVSKTVTWQLSAYLPGKNYGTPADEQILFVTHSDGPSISQDNGPLGLLAVAYYFAHIPQSRRPRTLAFFFDNRHYMPGGEAAFADNDWLAQNGPAADRVVAVLCMEHLGQIEFVEQGDRMRPSGRVNQSNLWVTNNQRMIDLATQAVADNRLKGVTVRAPARPGKHGRSQGPWYGLGRLADQLGKPGFATMGTMGAYWSTSSRLDRFDPNLFCRQVATFCQLTGELMLADMSRLQSEPAEQP